MLLGAEFFTDDVGNTTADEAGHLLVYDAWNRLARVDMVPSIGGGGDLPSQGGGGEFPGPDTPTTTPPETLTSYYVNSAAGQPEPLSKLLTLNTAIGGGKAVIGSNVKVAAAGALLDVPLGHKDDSWSFPHFDTITVSIVDAPRPDEILVVMAIADGGRLRNRCGTEPIW